MIVKSAEFIKSAAKENQYPAPVHPEIAFAGRSNVGKSSLINTLVNRKGLVKTSSTPGRTQLINFFTINERFSFVDLPGYGYARVPESVRRNWGPMIETYLKNRKNLNGVVLIMDVRRKPDHKDAELIRWLDRYRIPTVYVLTKADKFSKSRRKTQHVLITEALGLTESDAVLFSAKTRLGRDALWNRILTLLDSSENRHEGYE